MAFKKIITSSSDGFAIINTSKDKNRYPVGFQYMVEGVICSVMEDVTKDVGSEMRKVSLNDGTTEILTLEMIDDDIQTPGTVIINDGNNTDTETSQEEGEKESDNESTM